MNFKTTLVMLILVLGLGAFWLFSPAHKPEIAKEPEKPAAELKYVLDPRPEEKDIVRIQVELAGKPRQVFERSAKKDTPDQMEDWRMLEPIAAATESFQVSGIATTITTLQSRSSFEPGGKDAVSLADAGLEPPQATVTLLDKAGKQYVVEIGKKAAMSSDTYVRLGGQMNVLVANREIMPQIKKEASAYRAKKLLSLKQDDVTRIVIQHEGRTYDFSRGADKEWVVNAPLKAYGAKDKLNTVVSALALLRADEFVEDNPKSLATYGLAEPFLSATLTTETRKQLPAKPEDAAASQPAASQPAEPQFETLTATHSIAVGGFADMSKSEKRYAKLGDQPSVVSIRQTEVAKLTPKMSEWRDPAITRIQAAAATRLELTADGSTATIEKQNGVWVGSDDLTALEIPAVTDLLQTFEDIRAIDYMDDAKLAECGLEKPRAIVRVSAAGAVEPVTLKIGDVTKSGKNAYVQREGQPSVIVVSAAQAQRLAVTPLSLRARSVFDASENQVRRFELTREGTTFAAERFDGAWKLTAPADMPGDVPSIIMVASNLARLYARRVVAKGDDAAYGLDAPVVTAKFAVETPVTPPPATQTSQPAGPPEMQVAERSLSVGRKDGVAYCKRNDQPYVYELDETVFKLLTSELLERKLFAFKADDVAAIAVSLAAGGVEFARDGENWTFVPDPYVKPQQPKIKELVEAAAQLRVENYISFRGGDVATGPLATPAATLTIRLKDGKAATLKLAPETGETDPRIAAWVEEARVFRLPAETCKKLLNNLDYYLQADQPKPGAPPQSGMPPGGMPPFTPPPPDDE
ncbi:hypothetical protein RAS1_12340 [Phycisphaerae bacterium RAS1]|nr:hypothetical protein RAS1_12340 [Phycisphaerae bacterium RAS1]